MEIFSAADISFQFNSRVIADIFSKFFGEKHKNVKIPHLGVKLQRLSLGGQRLPLAFDWKLLMLKQTDAQQQQQLNDFSPE